MLNKIIALGLLGVVGLAYLYQTKRADESVTTTRLSNKQLISSASTSVSSSDAIISTQDVEISPLLNSNTADVKLNSETNLEEEDLFFSQFEHLTQGNFSNADRLTSAYVLENGTVSKGAIVDTFNVGDFDEFVRRVSTIEQSENAALRESILVEKLLDMDGIEIYSENYSCAGKICVVSFDFEGSDKDVDELAKFAKNYSFKNIVEDEYGNKHFKALYIETDDPSTLTLDHF
ncbi:hypothetical protein [uncultured Shewanella sp.]|uniref:hypothetical protein n=1 Tax=uncultured Shewanella sp. TaxID=173975 RepID=UPI00260D012C|nr:hypothetical protein [uncultured Shewanella sp.]